MNTKLKIDLVQVILDRWPETVVRLKIQSEYINISDISYELNISETEVYQLLEESVVYL
jgi:uncharacterized protein (DUF111 family)